MNELPKLTLEDLKIMLSFMGDREGYPDWLKYCSGCWNHFGEAATPIIAKKWPEEKPGEYAEKFKHRLETIGIGSVISAAKLEGYRLPSRGKLKATKAVAKPVESAADFDAIFKTLNDRKFDFANQPPKPHPVLKLGDVTISTAGNLTVLQAGPKAGKTAVVGAILAAIFNGNRVGPDTLGFSSENPHGKALLHFDTEQSRYDHDALIRRSLERAQIDEPPAWFESYCLTDISIPLRRQVIKWAVDRAAYDNRRLPGRGTPNHGGIFAIIIDGVADLCIDPNDPEEAFGLVDELHAESIQRDCPTVSVIHENPGSESGKTRGHLGSQLERKAETPLRMVKDAGTGITTMWSDRARHGHIPKEAGTCFQWSDTVGMHVSAGTAREIKASVKQAQFRDEVAKVFGSDDVLTYAALRERIMEVIELKIKAAENRIKTYQVEGVMTKHQTGTYSPK
jgi:hypothetical protein